MNLAEYLSESQISGMARFYPENFVPSENEYISSDGSLVLCRKCRLPRYIRKYMPLLKHDMYVRQDCDCDREHNMLIEKRERDRWVREYYNSDPYLRGVGEKYKNAHFSALPTDGCDSSYLYAKNRLEKIETGLESMLEKKEGWYLYSEESGNGKTCLASCFRNALLERGIPCVLVTDVDIVDDISERKTIEKAFTFETYYNVDVLIIDDIGTDKERNNGTVSAQTNRYMYSLINSRYVNGKVTCFTSNYKQSDLISIGYEKKIVDRICELAPDMIEIRGSSFRKPGISRPY